VIAIGGIPGSGTHTIFTTPSSLLTRWPSADSQPGKTTLAKTITARLNALNASSQTQPFVSSISTSNPPTPVAAFLPMDGYHLPRAALSAFPDPVTAHFRRGAEFTFDGAAFLALVKRLRAPITPDTRAILAPSFDHAVKDPVADDIAISPTHRIIVIEGNYVCLSRRPWLDAGRLMDELWFVNVRREVARARLVRRHIAAGICKDAEEAGQRADDNDLLNGDEILRERVDLSEEIESREDDFWIV
jgi:pantothenate kinase